MKKQIIILAAAIMPLAFFSCSKESIETQQPQNSMATNEANSSPKPGTAPIINLKNGLDGMFEFNSNLKDKTGKLPDAVPSLPIAVTYTTDRKGVANKAIQFTGRYGLDILNVPTQPNTSVAAWVKYNAVLSLGTVVRLLYSDNGPNFDQDSSAYFGVIITPNTTSVASPLMDNNWHHLVATYDGNDLKFYVDGKYMGNSTNPSQFPPHTLPYYVGYIPFDPNIPHWRGSMDDLCFYSRTLSAADVQKLYSM